MLSSVGMEPADATSDPWLAAVLGELAEAPARDLAAARGRLLGPGADLGRFEILRELGRGGFGVVLEARDKELGRRVALKVVHPDRHRGGAGSAPPRREAFRREAEAAARLQHANIVTLHDVGRAQGLSYLVLELLDGETLAERLSRGTLPVADAVAVAIDVAAGLAHAHARGIVHRDVKPGNVFVTRDGRAKVLDFGLARLLDEHGLGQAAGTPGFMAPEQWRCEDEDERTDVWALGVLLHVMVAGELPFARRQDVLGPARASRLPVDRALADAVLAALCKRRADRPRHAGEMLARLNGVRASIERREKRLRALRGAAIASLVAAALAPHAADALVRRAGDRAPAVAAAASHPDPLEAARRLARLGGEPVGAAAAALALLARRLPEAVFAAPGGPIVALAIEGKRAAVASARGAAVDGLALPAHAAALTAIELGPAGLAATAAEDGSVRLHGRRGSRTLPGHGAAVRGAAFSGDGRRLLTWSLDGTARVFAVRGGQPHSVLRAGQFPLAHASFSPDGLTVAAADFGGTGWVFDSSGQRRAALRGHSPFSAVRSARFDSKGTRIVTAGDDGTARVFPARGGRGTVAIRGTGPLTDAWFGPDGSVIAAGRDGTLHLGGAPARRGHGAPIVALRFGVAGAWMATVAADGSVRLWRRDGSSEQVPLGLPPGTLRAARFGDGGALLVAESDGAARLFRLDDPPAEPLVLVGHRGPVLALRFAAGAARLVSGGADGTARLWSLPGRQGLILDGHGGPVTAVAVDRDGTRVATASEDGSARLFASARLLVRRSWAAPLSAVALSPDGARIAAGDREGGLHVFGAADEPMSAPRRAAAVASLDFSHDGTRLVAAYADGLASIVRSADPAAPPLLSIRGRRPALWVRFVGADGALLAMADEAVLHAFAARTGAPLGARSLEGGKVFWEPGGRRAIVAAGAGARLVAADGSFAPIDLPGAGDAIASAAFSPDGSRVALGSLDGTVRVYSVGWPLLRERLALAARR